MTPEQMLNNTTQYLKAIEDAKRKHVAVGLPVEKVGAKVYGDGMTIFRVGAIHEFGTDKIPRRSFLRVPFATKNAEMADMLLKEFRAISEGKRTVDQALGRVGLLAENISKGAFTSRGYGTWPDIKASTKRRKESSQVLIDTGILRGSITSVVRDN